jgi:hypothetical protein
MNSTRSFQTRLRSSILAIVAVSVVGLALAACGSDSNTAAPQTAAAPETAAPESAGSTETAAAPETASVAAPAAAVETGSVFVGTLPDFDHGLVGVHLSEPDANGKRTARVYVCDGKATDDGGFALWFKGEVVEGGETALTAAGRTEKLTLTVGDTVTGTVSFDDGVAHTFDAPPSVNGAGIYNVTVGADGSYVGRSTLGDVLDAKLEGDPQTVSGTVTPRDAKSIPLHHMPALNNIVPGTFVAVGWWNEETQHLAMSGRSGDVRGGAPGLNVIGLCGWQ